MFRHLIFEFFFRQWHSEFLLQMVLVALDNALSISIHFHIQFSTYRHSLFLDNLPPVSTPFFEPVINWKFKFAEISLSISKGLNYLAIDVDDLSCNLPSIAKTALLVG